MSGTMSDTSAQQPSQEELEAYYAQMREAPIGEILMQCIELLAGEGSALIRRSSLGVLMGIMPWNFPYYQVARFVIPNLVVGNAIIMKQA